MINIEAAKTYTVGGFASLQVFIPNNCEEWTQLLQFFTAGLGLILVLWRMKIDMFRKRREKREKKKSVLP